MDMNTFFAINFSPLVGILFLYIVLFWNARIEPQLKRLFYSLLGMELIELIAYNAELVLAAGPHFSRWRILLSAVGYSLRPALVFVMLLLVYRRHKNRRIRLLMALPLLLNAVAAFSAFWTDAVYSYTEQNVFVRGPLGYTPHVCLLFYLTLFLVGTLGRLHRRERLESILLLAIVAMLVTATVVEAVWNVRSIGRTAIVQATVFYYLFFQTREYQLTLADEELAKNRFKKQANTDQLTGLLNKAAFLRELERALAARDDRYTVLVFVDLDHFKALNDTLGHRAGDEALQDTAVLLRGVFTSDDRLGRFGGDEFCALLRPRTVDRLDLQLAALRDTMRKSYTREGRTVGLTASIGAAIVEPSRHATPRPNARSRRCRRLRHQKEPPGRLPHRHPVSALTAGPHTAEIWRGPPRG